MKRILIQSHVEDIEGVAEAVRRVGTVAKEDVVFTSMPEEIFAAAGKEKILLVTGQILHGAAMAAFDGLVHAVATVSNMGIDEFDALRHGGCKLAEAMKALNSESLVYCYSITPKQCAWYDGYLRKSARVHENDVARLMTDCGPTDTPVTLATRHRFIQGHP